MKRGLCAAFLVLGGMGGIARPCPTAPVTINGDWVIFKWKDAPGVWSRNGPFTYDAATWTSLKVTDVKHDGDRFTVYDGGLLIGATSVPTNDGLRIKAIDAAYADPRWSSGEFFLPPGSHSLTLKTVTVAAGQTHGEGYLRVDTASPPYPSQAIPAPGAIGLSAFGAGLAAWSCRRRLV